MGTTPLRISIVTPTFNSASTIADTIDSVASQQWPEVEHIVMDGGSTDGTVDFLRSNQSRISHWRSAPDRGQYDAISRGFELASGDIFGWLNADDMLMPRALQIVAQVFESFPAVKWISSLQPGQWDSDGNLAGFSRTPGFSKAAFLDGLYLPGERRLGYWIQQESTFWRREIWTPAAISAMTEYRLAGDFALWSHFFKENQLVGVDYPLAGFRFRSGQRSEDMGRYIAEAREALCSARAEARSRPRKSAALLYHPLRRAMRVSQALERWSTRRLGYPGLRLINRNLRRPCGDWVLEEHAFLP